MVRAGLLSDDQLAAVQTLSSARKLSFVEALIEANAVDEDSIVAFLHSKLMIPRVGASVLEAVDPGALSRIPADLAQRHAVLPVSADETGNLTIAMVDPTDMRAVDAISAHTGAYLVRAVAPLRIVRAAIIKHYNLTPPAPTPAPTPIAPAPVAPVTAIEPQPAAVIKPSAVIRPAAVIQPSAVVMPGPRPAVVLPAGALASSYGNSPEPTARPSVPEPTARPSSPDPTPVSAPVPSVTPPVARTGPAGSAPSPVAPPVVGPAPVVPPPIVAPPPIAAPTVTPTVAPPPPSATPTQRIPVPMSAVSANITPTAALTNPGVPVPSTSAAIAPPSSAPQPPAPVTAPSNPLNAVPAPTHPLNTIQSPAVTGHTVPSPAITGQTVPTPVHPLNTIQSAHSPTSNPLNSLPATQAVFNPQPPPTFTPARDEPLPSAVSTKTMPLFELGRRNSDVTGTTIPGNQRPNDTLPGHQRVSDVVDIPLDDLEDTPPTPAAATPTSTPAAKPGRDADDAMTTANWNPPNYGVVHEVIPLSPEAFQRLLPRFSTVRTRDEVTDLLLDFLAEGFSRVIMFTHIKGEIRGRDARGEDLMVDAVRQIRIPATGPSLFSSVIERQMPYFGPMRTDTAIDAAFFGALGGVEGVVLCLPVLLRDKVPLLVFASGSHNPVDPRSLQDLTNEVAAALERLIVLEKTRR